ncbi:MAG: epoxyqueuosine reductase [Firmicutes bacterium]|nr:epoxyqueuosine reductase [Bacillota bacterium]
MKARVMAVSLKGEIEEYALDLGFDGVGFAAVDPFTGLTQALREREEGYRWTEQVLQLNRAADPRVVMPAARTLIVLLYDYHKLSFPAALLGKVGRVYLARLYPGRTRIFGSRLRLFRSFLEQKGMTVELRQTLPDRQAAVRAGLGTFGRNTFVHFPGRGSFVAPVVMAVDAELGGVFNEVGSRCPEDCNRCIEACPTGALYEPFKIDPLRCISFQTYCAGNVPGCPPDIPPEIREKMGSWVYGCDICQEVCPRNQSRLKQKLPSDPYLKKIAPHFTLEKLLNMGEDYYRARVQPLLYGYIWEKKFLQRNAAIALGNSAGEAALPHLSRSLSDKEPLVRRYSAWAVGRIGGRKGRALLERHRGRENDPGVLAETGAALEQL